MVLFFKKYQRFLFHLSFWLVYLSFFLYQIGNRHPNERIDWPHLLSIGSTHIFFTLFISYFNFQFLIPRYLIKKKIGIYFLLFIPSFLIILTINIFCAFLINNWLIHFPDHFSLTRFIIQVGANMLFVVIFISSLRFSFERFEMEARQKALENERLFAEINFLKAQINPHFLFNTLNNLYYLAYTHSENTTEVISKLSKMMRYMIYDSNHERVRISQEIEYMQNYIDLEKLRLNNQIPIDFKITGTETEAMFAPLILITFLENAFKHGAGNSSSDAWIRIHLHIQNQILIFKIINSKPESGKLTIHEKSGIGLQNVNRRLELTYPGAFNLQSKDTKDQYSVELTVNLNQDQDHAHTISYNR